ncbi:CAP domain-containing protein [Streptomyces achmelvichensis]|uniref:CAP domain-containing protein n=1 Tax=Streptomyces achmelvichensis TaxID=3134111 RepID=UPI003C12BE54
MNSTCRAALWVAGAVLTALPPCASTAWAEESVTGASAHNARQWPVARSVQRPAPPGLRAGPAAEATAALNLRRTWAGCHPVQLQATLTRAARAHSVDMVRHEHLGHIGSDGSSPQDRMRAAGYRPHYSGEVVAAGTSTASAAVAAWMDSPRHRDIILNCRYTDAGVGMMNGPGGPWWALVLATRR